MSNRNLLLSAVLLMTVAAACGGSGSSPVAPAAPASVAPSASAAASISGSVLSGASSATTSSNTGNAINGLVVTVAGTNIKSSTDAAGRFRLDGVPTGNIQLQFTGPITATIPVAQVQPNETITLVLRLTPITVTLESQQRSSGNSIVSLNVNGVIDSLEGTAASFQFRIGSRVVKGDALTAFFGDGDTPDTFADLANGDRVEVKGAQRDGYVYAERIHINGVEDDDQDDHDEQDSSASIHGTVNALSGTPPSLVLTVGTTIVRTNSDTEVKRRGDVQTLAEVRLGQDVHVIGVRQPDGSLIARRIELNADAPGAEVEVEGSAGGVTGTCPAIAFKINGYLVQTSATTVFENVTCASMKGGTKVTAKGTSGPGGLILATRIKG